mmetsp:Transcript_15909/g.44437  ORF Transcript_15909/g.44437 Transcript_15909/m.44437 type:complete len:202 (-) Transcript_15909:152-757(-)
MAGRPSFSLAGFSREGCGGCARAAGDGDGPAAPSFPSVALLASPGALPEDWRPDGACTLGAAVAWPVATDPSSSSASVVCFLAADGRTLLGRSRVVPTECFSALEFGEPREVMTPLRPTGGLSDEEVCGGVPTAEAAGSGAVLGRGSDVGVNGRDALCWLLRCEVSAAAEVSAEVALCMEAHRCEASTLASTVSRILLRAE